VHPASRIHLRPRVLTFSRPRHPQSQQNTNRTIESRPYKQTNLLHLRLLPCSLPLLSSPFHQSFSPVPYQSVKMSPSPSRLLLLPDAWLTAPVLFALLYYPQRLQSILPARLHPLITSPRFIRALKVALGISVARKLNKSYPNSSSTTGRATRYSSRARRSC
jgi:hypothetical protein